MVPSAKRRPTLDRSQAAVLDAATRLLLDSPELSLGELAARIGIGRTTLHRMFPTREALLVGVAHDAIDHLTEVYAQAGLDPDLAEPNSGNDVVAPFRRMVEMLVPLGPQLMFLLRADVLRDDADIERRIVELDQPLLRAVENLQRVGALDPDLPVWWVTESLYAVVYVAWEQVESGRLAARDAAPLVMRTWLRGTQGPATQGPAAQGSATQGSGT